MNKFKDVGKGKQDRSSEARQQGKDTTLDLIWRTKSGGMWWGTPSYFVEMQISRSVQRGESSMGKKQNKKPNKTKHRKQSTSLHSP